MRFWRICSRRYAAKAATGEGAALYPGRWNRRGVRVIYASTSLALAATEIFVHLHPKTQPNDLVSIEGQIPDELKIDRVDLHRLPRDWHEPRETSPREFADDWIRNGKTVALLVPSAAIQGEWNLLLNPAHTDFPKIKFNKPAPFKFDVRMFP
ncbi:MAG TPA: RES family NAD+ phosphorylase [Pyrinomonadaceae bacterium]|nr:RES family NAD+ phosphorylase [Pyrinomonadaceae bacterium]